MKENLSYIIKRLLYLIPVILGVCFIVFFLFNLVSGDPATNYLGPHAKPETINELRELWGLNQPWYLQYFDIVKSAFTLDFGKSRSSNQVIMELISKRALPSLMISFPAFFISTVLSILLAMVTAHYRGKGIDYVVRIVCIAMMSISSLTYILFFQWYFGFELDWFYIDGFEADLGFFSNLPYIILPVIIWVILSIGPDVRFFRTIILDEIYQDYVRTARAKGLSETKVLLKHVLANSMIPILTYTIIQLPFLLLGSLLLEQFFSIPGLGDLMITAINESDFPVIKAMTILSAMAYLVFTIIQDIMYVLVDPRVKLK